MATLTIKNGCQFSPRFIPLQILHCNPSVSKVLLSEKYFSKVFINYNTYTVCLSASEVITGRSTHLIAFEEAIYIRTHMYKLFTLYCYGILLMNILMYVYTVNVRVHTYNIDNHYDKPPGK